MRYRAIHAVAAILIASQIFAAVPKSPSLQSLWKSYEGSGGVYKMQNGRHELSITDRSKGDTVIAHVGVDFVVLVARKHLGKKDSWYMVIPMSAIDLNIFQ